MKTRKLTTILLTALLLAATAPAFAHDTWLQPRRASVPEGGRASFDLTSGMAFPLLDYAIKPERVETARYRLGGKVSELAARRGRHSLRLDGRLTGGVGVAAVWVALKPNALELTPAQVREYLDEIDAPVEIRRAWESAAEPRRWRETYAKHSKTFVRVGAGRGEDRSSWAEPVGMALEIVPEVDPTGLRAGDELPVRVLKDGAPLADFPLGIVREGNSFGALKKTDREGRVSFKLARAGRWLLRGTRLQKSGRPETDWESDFTTMTVTVEPAQKRRG